MLISNPQKCPICRAHWDFKTDSLGYVHAIHPITKCISVAAVYEKEDEEDEQDFIERTCDECHEKFKPKKNAKSQTICGPECREARRTRKHLEGKKIGDWKLTVLKDLNLPTRQCTECPRMFTITNKFGVKRLVCSRVCRKAREARKSKERKAA